MLKYFNYLYTLIIRDKILLIYHPSLHLKYFPTDNLFIEVFFHYSMNFMSCLL